VLANVFLVVEAICSTEFNCPYSSTCTTFSLVFHPIIGPISLTCSNVKHIVQWDRINGRNGKPIA
jgi:hypothetical protein